MTFLKSCAVANCMTATACCCGLIFYLVKGLLFLFLLQVHSRQGIFCRPVGERKPAEGLLCDEYHVWLQSPQRCLLQHCQAVRQLCGAHPLQGDVSSHGLPWDCNDSGAAPAHYGGQCKGRVQFMSEMDGAA